MRSNQSCWLLSMPVRRVCVCVLGFFRHIPQCIGAGTISPNVIAFFFANNIFLAFKTEIVEPNDGRRLPVLVLVFLLNPFSPSSSSFSSCLWVFWMFWMF